jgi:hypothetical protein
LWLRELVTAHGLASEQELESAWRLVRLPVVMELLPRELQLRQARSSPSLEPQWRELPSVLDSLAAWRLVQNSPFGQDWPIVLNWPHPAVRVNPLEHFSESHPLSIDC